MSIQIDTREAGFAALADALRQAMRPGEDFTLWYSAEASDFIRFNHARVRQAGHVSQAGATLQLIAAERQAQMAVTLSGQPDEDRQRLADGLERLRAVIGQLPPDPYLMPDRTPWQRRHVDTQPLPDPAAVLPCISAAAEGLDLVGITPPARSTGASPTAGAPSAGTAPTASTSTSACSTPTARR